MSEEKRLETFILEVLESLGYTVSTVRVTDYDAEVFGNHLAQVDTNEGHIAIVFDRQYDVVRRGSSINPTRIPEIENALRSAWNTTGRLQGI